MDRCLPRPLAVLSSVTLASAVLIAGGALAQSSAPSEARGETAAPGDPRHPMDALAPDELRRAVDVLRTAGRLADDAKFPTLDLAENDKEAVRAWRPGEPFERRAFAVVMQGGRVYESVVDLRRGEVESWREVEGVEPRVLLAETAVNDVLWSSSDWRDAMAKRGYEDGERVFCAPLTPGPALPDEYAGRRILYSSCFDISDPDALAFGRPVEGLMAVVDVGSREVLSVVDLGVGPLPEDAASLGYERSARYRSPARPVEIVAPEGSNVRIDGSQVRWDNWSFHLRVDQRVGPVISLIRYDDRGDERDVLYQLAVSEMFVPYMDPASTWSWKAYMDVGEYGFGVLASSLRSGVDCPASAHLLDRTIADDDGRPIELRDSVCIFERPTGDPLWRHAGDDAHEGAENVELVVRMAPVIGNYDYFIDYVFDRAGEIDVRVGATGIDAVKAVAARSMLDPTAATDTAYGTLIGKGLVGINHDHYVSFRVDVDIDGVSNRAVFDRVTTQTLPADNPRRSLWTVVAEPVAEAGPLPHALHDGFLRIENDDRTNALGNPTSYQLFAGRTAPSILSPEDPIQVRAEWSRHPVWLSRHAPNQRYASGAYPNQNAAADGLTKWTEGRQGLDGEDVVLWYNVGFRHITRAEDWPAMPTVWHSFRLRPFNFFDASPAMDVRR